MTWTDWFDELPDEIKLFVRKKILEKNGEIETSNMKYIGSKVDVTIAKASAFQDLVLKAREVKK